VTVVRVLVVDDQAAFLRAMTSVVRETPGFEVAGEASSGEECLIVAAELRPDLVLMDVRLPGIDGVAATRRLLAAAGGFSGHRVEPVASR
jgi:DNA-binding NarL/FixJ family response regulator